MSLRIIKTTDRLDFELLSLANEKRKFGVGLTTVLEPDLQAAFERGIDQQWFTFIDLSPVYSALPNGGFVRLFRLTDVGVARRDELVRQFGAGQ